MTCVAACPPTAALHDGFDVGDVDAIACDFGAVGVDDQAGLAEFANDGEFLEAGCFVENVADFDGFFLEDIEIGAENFDGERGLETGESFVDGVFGRLREVEDDAGIGVEFFLEVAGQIPPWCELIRISKTCHRRASSRHKTHN